MGHILSKNVGNYIIGNFENKEKEKEIIAQILKKIMNTPWKLRK